MTVLLSCHCGALLLHYEQRVSDLGPSSIRLYGVSVGAHSVATRMHLYPTKETNWDGSRSHYGPTGNRVNPSTSPRNVLGPTAGKYWLMLYSAQIRTQGTHPMA
jgi:hypothetical protein